MLRQHKSCLRSFSLLAAGALALGACVPATAIPTAAPLPTATAAASATSAGPATATPLPVAVGPAPATSVFLQSASGMAFDAAGNMYVSSCFGPQVSKVDSFGLLTVFT